MSVSLAVPLGSRPVINWQGFDAIGQRARIEGDSEVGFRLCYFSEEDREWRAPRDLDEYRWIVEAFLGEVVLQSVG